MRTAVLGLLVGVGLIVLVVGVWSERNRVFAQVPAERAADRGEKDSKLIAFSVEVGADRQQITLIDPTSRAMSVYHVKTATGEIELKSVRQFHWDLQMEEFNGATPSPREIRSLLQQR
jgi:hypothetical protein